MAGDQQSLDAVVDLTDPPEHPLHVTRVEVTTGYDPAAPLSSLRGQFRRRECADGGRAQDEIRDSPGVGQEPPDPPGRLDASPRQGPLVIAARGPYSLRSRFSAA